MITGAKNSPSTPVGDSITLAEMELVHSLSWLIELRWLACAAVLLGTAFAAHILDIPVEVTWLYLLGFWLFATNVVYAWALRRLESQAAAPINTYQWFARIQIGLDWLATTVLVHLTGGIESPAILFFLFHIIVSSLLLPHDRGFLYVGLAPVLVGGVALAEYQGLAPHVSLYGSTLHSDSLFILGRLLFFGGACYVTAYVSMTISRRLRRREDQLAALYRSLRVTTSTLELSHVLDRLAEATTQALHCKAASIRLLSRSGSHLDLAGSFGLSEAYRGRGAVEVARSRIDQEVLRGKPLHIVDVLRDERIFQPEQMAQEGIRTMLIAPLMGKTGPIGVLRAYGGVAHRFSKDETEFLTAIAAQGAVAIENAQAFHLLEELDSTKSRFVRIVTHELRSPVSVSLSLLTLLDRGYVGELTPQQADLVARAQRRISFLQSLIDDLLDLAAGKVDTLLTDTRSQVSLTSVMERVGARYEPRAVEKGIELIPEKPEADLLIWADAQELDRLLDNLVSNAVKYTPHGRVRLALERAGESARITVQDTGLGIPDEAFPHLFQEFYRAPNAREVEESGTGLGLAIVKDLVTRYGGEISVDSALNQGTTFTIRLPLVGGGSPPPGDADAAGAAPDSGQAF